MLTSDFILPDSTPNVVPGPPVLRSTVRVWDFEKRQVIKTITAPGAMAVVLTNGSDGDKWMNTYRPNARFYDATGHIPDPITTSA